MGSELPEEMPKIPAEWLDEIYEPRELTAEDWAELESLPVHPLPPKRTAPT